MERNKGIADQLKHLRTSNDEIPDDEQLKAQISDLDNRYTRMITWVDDSCKEIEEVLPVAERLELAMLPVKTLHKDIESEMKDKNTTGAELDLIAAEVEKMKVSELFLFGCGYSGGN